MTHLRVSEAATYLGVSDDTVRRLIDQGELGSARDERGRLVVPGAEVAAQLARRAGAPDDGGSTRSSARNRFTGIVTRIVTDTVMAQVELQCGPFRVVSLMSTEAVHDLRLQVGDLATAAVKSTAVVIERDPQRLGSEA